MAAQPQVALIGTAGRGEPLTQDCFRRMKSLAICSLEELGYDPKEVVLVSGGSAWADHAAVQLYLEGKVAGLKLKLPGHIVEEKSRVFLRPVEDSLRPNQCYGLSSLHDSFSKALEINSLKEIKKAIDKGAEVDVSDGFFARNRKIAKDCDALIALHDKRQHPSLQRNGGTKYTFHITKGPKLYVPVNDHNNKKFNWDAFGYPGEEAEKVQNVFKRFRNCFKGPMDAFLKRRLEDEADSQPSPKRRKGLKKTKN